MADDLTPPNADHNDDVGTGDADEPLGEAGQRALDAERRKHRQAAAAAEDAGRRLKALEAELDKLRSATMSDTERAVAEAEARGQATARTEMLGTLARSEIRLAAAGHLVDPDDAIRWLDDPASYIGADGEIDRQAIRKAVEDLVRERPYLAAPANGNGATPNPFDGGARTPVRAVDMNQMLRARAGRA